MSEPNNLPITAWAEDDRPREKLLLKGRSALSDAELIAILIGSGTQKMSAVDLSKRILSEQKNNLNELARLSIKELMKHKGIGEAKAITIAAAMELGRRLQASEVLEQKKITSSSQLYAHIKPKLADLLHEEFHVLCLKNNMRVHKEEYISTGGMTGTVADVRLIMHRVLDGKTTGIVLCHNHPSGTLKPSQQDINLTRRLKEACQIMDIALHDHIIVTNGGYYSFADDGQL